MWMALLVFGDTYFVAEFGLPVRQPAPTREIAVNRVNATKVTATTFLRGRCRVARVCAATGAVGLTRPDLPMTTFASLLLGAAMAGLYHLLPYTRPGRPFRAAAVGHRRLHSGSGGICPPRSRGLGWCRRGPFHDLLHELTK